MNFLSKCTAAVMLMAAAAGAAMAAPGAKNELPSADIRLKAIRR